MNDTTHRLDMVLLARGLVASRAKARDAVLRGHVRVDGVLITKPAATIRQNATLEIDDPAQRYVSRAALKLVAGLDRFSLDPSGLAALDLGASTGGFTQVLLERGAAHVHAIDVGHGQMHPAISGDPRVTLIEGLNARDLSLADLGGHAPDFIVCDVSFISLKLVLPAITALAAQDAVLVALIKPQFEAGRERVKKGVVRDAAVHQAVCDDIAATVATLGWRMRGLIPSPIAGGDGNVEFLLAADKH